MSRIVFLVFISFLVLIGADTSPETPQSSEGKSVYFPPSPHVDKVMEERIQKEDQNSTRHGRTQ